MKNTNISEIEILGEKNISKNKPKFDLSSRNAEEFINHEEILATLEWAKENKDNHELIRKILSKAALKKGLDYRDVALLVEREDRELIKEMFNLSEKVKSEIYGNRIVLFAPLYLSNYCVNGCVYCPYHHQNKEIPRKKLTQEEIKREVIALQDMGHKRLAIEVGEDPVHAPIDYIPESIKTIYSIKHKNGAIRRINVNIAATTVENYKKLHEAEIGTYILFQETYNKKMYEEMHPTGPKHNYNWHTEAHDRAMEAGIDDVGLGVLFGLETYKYELVGLMMHALHLETVFGVGPHTISMPRIKNADDIDASEFSNAISDEIFEKLCSIIRLAVPYTGMIVSTREGEDVRGRMLKIGISQISGASKTSVGGYDVEKVDNKTEQFDISDNRTLDEIVDWLMKLGFIPSFCTACYREGRTGDRFMQLSKSGEIQNCCHPNAIMTLKEYLEDYASPTTKETGEAIIIKELENIPREKVRNIAKNYIEQIHTGRRDFRF